MSNALEPVSSVSHVVTRFCTDIRFTRLLSPVCTLLIISTYSLCRFTSFQELAFSKLKIIKTRLRASLGND